MEIFFFRNAFFASNFPSRFPNQRRWKDGKVMTALVDSLEPGVCPLSEMTGDAYKDVDHAMEIARDEFGIPKILEATDVIDFPDDLAMLYALTRR